MEEKRKQTKKQLFYEILRFLLVGGTATAIDYLVFWAFDAWIFPAVFGESATLSLVLSVALGFSVGLIFNWIFSVVFVFRGVKNGVNVRSKKEFLTFTCIGLIGLLFNELVVLLLVWLLPEISLLGATTFLGMAWAKWLAKAVATLIVLTWNYLGRKLLIFKQ